MAVIKDLPLDKEPSTSTYNVVHGLVEDSSDEEDFSSDEEMDDSDRELQIAFQKGFLKPGLNIVQNVIQKKWIHNVSGLKTKLADLRNNLDWIERMDVTVERKIDQTDNVKSENDFKREVSFIKQAQNAVTIGLQKLQKLGVVTKRPEDYYAEMFKTDAQMKKVRGKLLDMQTSKEKSEAARRIREERKFATRIQKDVTLERQKDKKVLSDAVKKHKKGLKDQFEKIIGDGDSNSTNRRLNKKRELKDAKYGHGGQKKRGKWNTAESAADMSGFDSKKFSKVKKSGAHRRQEK